MDDLLEYQEPTPVKRTEIHEARAFDDKDPKYYSKFLTVETVHGFVTILDFDWMTNKGPSIWVELRMIKDGMLHRAYMKKGRLSDQAIRNTCTRFANKIYNP